MGRVISYGEKTGYNDGDYLLLDNGTGGTKRIRADRVGIQLDPTLTNPNKAAPANAVKRLKEDLTEFGHNKISLYNSANNNDGKYWDSEGTLNDSPSWTVTEQMAIVSDKEMYYTGISSTGSNPKAVFFDGNKALN